MAVGLTELGSFRAAVAIVFGSVPGLTGTVVGLWVTGTTLNTLSFLGAIVSVIGALCISMLFSLIATPTVYCLIMRLREKPAGQELAPHE